MKIVILDGYGANPGDLSWDRLKDFGDVEIYERTPFSQVAIRAENADILVLNAVEITEDIFQKLPALKLITLTATGYNSIDLQAARRHNVAVCNTPAYSTEAVAQHTIALLLEITNHVALHNSAVQQGAWYKSPDECFSLKPLSLLHGKTLGIVGYGNIGKRVGNIGEALGMTVIPYSLRPEAAIKADVVSLHCPLTAENTGIINASFISQMKDGAILLNTARGALIDESALSAALKSGKLSAAGVDVIKIEPPRNPKDCPLIGLENCYITPHHSWTPIETRKVLIDTTYQNIKSFIDGKMHNRVDVKMNIGKDI